MADINQQGAPSKGGRLTTWLAMPFTTSMDAFSWVLFLGFVMIVAFAWTRVLSHIVE
jgi:hypothetical protein